MRQVKHRSIVEKLTRMSMLVSGIALLVACASFIGFDMLTYRANKVRSVSTQAQIIGSNAVSALLFNDPQSAEDTLSALQAAPSVVSAGICTLDGRVFASYSRDHTLITAPILPAGQSETYSVSDKQIVLARSIVFKGKPTGIVWIRSDVQELTRRLKRYVGIAAIVMVASLLAAFFLSAMYRKEITEPIVSLAELARIVSRDKNYSLRATSAGSTAETSVLVDAFNNMLAQIQERDKELLEAHDELEQRVRDRTAELAAANKELEAFSYSVSHDLRAPLRSIDGFSLALIEDYGTKLDQDGKDYLRRVRGASQRMSQLIDDMLNLARVTRRSMQRETVDLSALAKSIADDLSKEEPNRQVEFSIAEGLTADADSGLMKIAMQNLIGNAWKYTSAHDYARIEFGRTNQNGSSAYFVKDDGAGFDSRYVERLFGAFQRLHAATEFPGTGIGLATVQRIIHRHGGQVWAEGAVERGATFYFTL
ncbi:MAG: ATP-binding protein [Candidatus Acidiferrales bacterium]|jgi:signal transduction histidine kinase